MEQRTIGMRNEGMNQDWERQKATSEKKVSRVFIAFTMGLATGMLLVYAGIYIMPMILR